MSTLEERVADLEGQMTELSGAVVQIREAIRDLEQRTSQGAPPLVIPGTPWLVPVSPGALRAPGPPCGATTSTKFAFRAV
jgi:hypothetical protein